MLRGFPNEAFHTVALSSLLTLEVMGIFWKHADSWIKSQASARRADTGNRAGPLYTGELCCAEHMELSEE